MIFVYMYRTTAPLSLPIEIILSDDNITPEGLEIVKEWQSGICIQIFIYMYVHIYI
jgi:hypothetical protein